MRIVFIVIALLFSSILNAQDFSLLDNTLKANQKALGGKICMLVYKDGKIVYEKDLGYTKTTIEPIASCCKWFTAAMVMTFVEEGKLSLDDTIGKFLPIFSKHKKGKIKIWNCLSHTTGIQGEEINLTTLLKRKKYKSLEEEVNDFALKPVAAAPGDQFYYGNIGLNIAGRILEVISGKNFETLFQERIAAPLGMKNTTFKSDHAVNPSGGAESSASDYMNFLIMILNKGEFNGKRILKAGSVELMEESHTEDVKVSYVPDQAMGMEYGFGEWILERDDDDNSSVVSSPGLLGTFPFINIANDYAAILFVRTLNFKNRNEIYKSVKTSIDKALGE